MPSRVKSRHVFYVCGYDWKGWRYYAKLFEREINRHCAATGAKATLGDPEEAADGISVRWRVQISRGDAEMVETVYEFLLWDQVIDTFHQAPLLKKLGLMWVALVDNVVTGTVFKMTALNWRFALFWIYPIVMMTAFMTLGALVGMGGANVVALGGFAGWAGWAAGILLAVAVFFGLLRLVDRHNGQVEMLLDALIFNIFHVRRKVDAMNSRLAQWVERVARAATNPTLDEVLIVGHSWGTVHAIDIAGELARAGTVGGAGQPLVAVMTIGATTPAIAQHPAAGWLRQAISDLAKSPHILWVEYQARKDFINFPGVDVVEGAGVTLLAQERRATCVSHVKFRKLLNPDFYKSIRKNLFRLHFQFLMANDVANQDYDYFDIVTGPKTLWERNGVAAPGVK